MPRRHASLIPLSHDHHQGLVLAFRLRHGADAAWTGQWPAEPAGQAREAVRFFADHLEPHFAAEEEILFPALRPYLLEGEGIVDNLLDQHRQIRGDVAALPSAEPAALQGKLRALGDLLEAHIRIEERDLFPLCEARFPPDHMARIGEQLAARRPPQS